jgi:hypothetical protein
MTMKFVYDKTPAHHALRLRKLQEQIEKERAKLRDLEKEAEQLKTFLLKVNRGKSFAFNGTLYQMCVKVTRSARMVLDQEECKRLLKSRTPYKPANVVKVAIDYVYED